MVTNRPARPAAPSQKVAAAVIEFVYGPLADNPQRVGKPLRFELKGLHIASQGDVRLLYRIADRVTIVAVEHRSDACRRGKVGR